ncbi:ATP-binding protein [Trichlorobacter lovleyi]|uniref:ATP-binding protein n=1 Tax=Trichlorobacter lovleyi TaxID=313985 RepID=UPI00223EF89B|nr:ATP-binding protein [Trichlorobacter lovleyi]QOX79167.1 ATP-binding protein [Trichlorobacter lovleyi]
MKNQIQLQIKVPNQTRYLSLIGRISEELAAQLQNYSGDREALANHINVVLTEALVNAIRHANADNPDEEVEIRIIGTDEELLLQVVDHGSGFDLAGIAHSPATAGDDLEDHGRGLYIMRSLMDSVEYRQVEGGNILEMRKRFH